MGDANRRGTREERIKQAEAMPAKSRKMTKREEREIINQTVNEYVGKVFNGMFGASMRCHECNQYKPDRCTCNKDPELKGVQGGNCNRTACQQPGATWYNKGTYKYYCAKCAEMINREPCEDGTLPCTQPIFQ